MPGDMILYLQAIWVVHSKNNCIKLSTKLRNNDICHEITVRNLCCLVSMLSFTVVFVHNNIDRKECF